MMLKAKESKGKGDRKSKKSTHVRFFLPSSPSSSSTLARGAAADYDDSDDDIHALSPPSSSSSAARATSRSSSSHTPSSSHSSRSAPSFSPASSSGPPRRPPPSLPSSSSSASSSSALPRRPPSSSSTSSSFPSTPTADSLSSSSRVRLPPSSFSYLTPSALTSAPSLSSASSAPRRPPSSSTFFAPPPARSSFSSSTFSSTAALSSSSSSTASLPGSSTGSTDHGWDRYRSAVARAAAASSATPAATRPSPPPPQWRDDTDVSSSSSAGSDEDESLDAIDATYSSATASPPPPSMSATEGEATTASVMSSGASSSSSTHSPVPSFSSSPVPGSSQGAARSSSPTRAALPPPRRSSADPPSPEASVERAPASFACARPFDGVKDVNDVAAALEAWLVPPSSDQGTAKQKKTKIRFGVEVGRLSEPRCSLRVSHLTGAEGRKSRKWADVRRNTVALSFAFVVKEGVNVFELGELSGSIKNLLMLIGSDELDTDLESKLVDEGAGSSKILLLNLLFHDECLFRALSAVLGHHRIEQADASLLLSHAPADCRSRRARLESIDARLVVDAVISRSILRFAEELMINLRRETATASASAPSSSAEQSGPASKERHRTGSDARTTKKRRRQTKQEQRRLAGALLRKYGQQLLGVPGLVGDDDGSAVTRLICLLRALNDIRFFVEFDSLDEFVRRLWRQTTPDSGPTPSAASRTRRSVSEEGELGAVKERKMKIKSRSKSKTQSKRRTKTETSETTDKTAKKKKKKRLSTDSKRRSGSTSARESKRKNSDGARRRSKKSSSSRRRESRDDDPAVSYSWHSLHAYLLASYEQLVRQTTAACLSDDESDDDKRDMGREIEEGLVASVRDMTLKLQSLSAIHSVRAIVGDDVLLVACEGMQVFEVLPSPEEMIAIERAAKRDAKKRHRRTVDDASTAAKKSESSRTGAKRERTTGHDKIEEDLSRSLATKVVPSLASTGGASHPLQSPRREKVNIKLMVLGDLRVGKTSLIQRFMRGSAFALSKYKPTYAADFVHKNVVLLDKPRTLQIWDTSGNERQRAPDRAFFKGVDALVLVFDQRRASTFLPALDRHLDDFLAHAACPNPRQLPIVVIGNRCGEASPSGSGGTESDGEGLEREVKRSEVEAWCRGRIEGNRLFAYFEVSAKEGTHVDDAFLHAANAVLDIHYGVI